MSAGFGLCRVAVIAAGWPGLRGEWVRRLGLGQPVAAGSVLSFSNAALSASVHGQAAGRCSLAWRAENAKRAAMCSEPGRVSRRL